MTEHLVLENDNSVDARIEYPDSDSRLGAEMSLGIGVVDLLGSLESTEPDVKNNSNSAGESMEAVISSPEGDHNAELFKQAYDTAIEAIETALEAQGTELSSKLDSILNSIDVLSATPYIASVPEFNDLVTAVRSNITEANFYITRNSSPEMSLAVANAINQAKQKLAGTTVAYSPRS